MNSLAASDGIDAMADNRLLSVVTGPPRTEYSEEMSSARSASADHQAGFGRNLEPVVVVVRRAVGRPTEGRDELTSISPLGPASSARP